MRLEAGRQRVDKQRIVIYNQDFRIEPPPLSRGSSSQRRLASRKPDGDLHDSLVPPLFFLPLWLPDGF